MLLTPVINVDTKLNMVMPPNPVNIVNITFNENNA